jgi:L-arabinokinase
VTRVDPQETYYPRACAEHPIFENARVMQFIALMRIAEIQQQERPGAIPDAALMRYVGELMYEAHASYSDRIRLGSPETDLLVELVRQAGEPRGLYGAKITGGGSGGTVAVLCTQAPDADQALEEICAAYAERAGIAPRLFLGSSPGALSFGTRYIERH